MQTRLFLAPRFLSASVVIGLLLIGLETAARAQSASDAPCSELTKQLFGPDAGKCSTISQAPAATPQPTATETAPPKGPLYSIAGEIYTIDRDMTAYYYFQSNYGGTAKAKYEYRYGRDLWNDNAQLRIRIPIITKWSQTAPTLSGLGNIELGYSYAVSSKIFDHYLELRVSTPTAANNASSNDTELKGFYNLKWRSPGFNVSYSNEYDQTIIKPPGSTWTSYYEGKLTFPDAKVLPGLNGLDVLQLSRTLRQLRRIPGRLRRDDLRKSERRRAIPYRFVGPWWFEQPLALQTRGQRNRATLAPLQPGDTTCLIGSPTPCGTIPRSRSSWRSRSAIMSESSATAGSVSAR